MNSRLFGSIILGLAVGGSMTCGRSKPADVNDISADGEVRAFGDSDDAQAISGPGDGGLADGSSAGEVGPLPLVLPEICATDTLIPPKNLVCTGLYEDIVGKVTAPGVAPYAPAIPLWSDGATKQRWIALPAGGIIDSSNPEEWIFPVGTKVWKEFSRGGQRVETRLWQKVRNGYWVDGTYVWNADESAGVLGGGGDIVLDDGSAYHIPTQDECEKCHRGRTEHILGFEQVLLGLPGATGLTLDTLVQQGKLSAPPASTALAIGDDGTGAAAPALGWLHVNCGVTCHNDNSNSTAYAAGMLLRLSPAELDGRAVDATFDPVRTTVGVVVGTPNWSGQTRIVPGSPQQSLIYQLISHRGMGMQMPPIATNLVDEVNDARIAAWIAGMPPAAPPPAQDASAPPPPDAGSAMPPDAAADSSLPSTSSGGAPGSGGVSGSGGQLSGTGGMSGTGGVVSGTGGEVSGTGGVVSGTGGEVSGTGGMVSGTGGMVSGTGGMVSGTGGVSSTGGVSTGGGSGTDAGSTDAGSSTDAGTAGVSGTDAGGTGAAGGSGAGANGGAAGGGGQGGGLADGAGGNLAMASEN